MSMRARPGLGKSSRADEDSSGKSRGSPVSPRGGCRFRQVPARVAGVRRLPSGCPGLGGLAGSSTLSRGTIRPLSGTLPGATLGTMPVLVWIAIAAVGAAFGTALVAPALVRDRNPPPAYRLPAPPRDDPAVPDPRRRSRPSEEGARSAEDGRGRREPLAIGPAEPGSGPRERRDGWRPYFDSGPEAPSAVQVPKPPDGSID